MYFKIWTKLLLRSSTEMLNRWEMGSAVVQACPEDFELKLRDSWTQPCSQFTRHPSQETLGFLRDFSISQPCTAHTHGTGGSPHRGTTRCPSLRHRIFGGLCPLNWFNEVAQVPWKGEPLAACTSSCCPAQSLWKQPEESGDTSAYSRSRSAKDDSPQSEESHRKGRCSSVGLGALKCHRTIFSLKAHI